MDALIPVCKAQAAQLQQLRVKRGDPGVDKARPAQKEVQHSRPTGQREKQVVIGVGLVPPHRKLVLQCGRELCGVGFGKMPVIVCHKLSSRMPELRAQTADADAFRTNGRGGTQCGAQLLSGVVAMRQALSWL